LIHLYPTSTPRAVATKTDDAADRRLFPVLVPGEVGRDDEE